MAKGKEAYRRLTLADLFGEESVKNATLPAAPPKPQKSERFEFRPKRLVTFMIQFVCIKCGHNFEPVPKFAESSTFVFGRLRKRVEFDHWISCGDYRPYNGGLTELSHETEVEHHALKQCPHCFEPRETTPIIGGFSSTQQPVAVNYAADRHIKEPKWEQP